MSKNQSRLGKVRLYLKESSLVWGKAQLQIGRILSHRSVGLWRAKQIGLSLLGRSKQGWKALAVGKRDERVARTDCSSKNILPGGQFTLRGSCKLSQAGGKPKFRSLEEGEKLNPKFG